MLYHDTSRKGFEAATPAVGMRLASPYAHHVNDALAIANLYAFNRLIYMNPAPDPGYKFKFSRSIRSHNSVMVDGHIPVDPATSWAKTGSVEPGFTTDLATRWAFTPQVKFVAARTSHRYEGADETRVLMLTEHYLLDIFRCIDDQPHSYTWIAHTFGKATPEGAAQWKPSTELADRLISPQFLDPLALDTGGKPWAVTVLQVPAEETRDHPRYAAWWQRPVGVKVHMLGQPDTTASVAGSQVPYTNNERNPVGPRFVDGVAILATRWADSATFVAVHEPYEKQPALTGVRTVAQTDDAVCIAIAGPGFDDRLMVRFGDNADRPLTLGDGNESHTFTGWAFIRTTDTQRIVQGNLAAR